MTRDEFQKLFAQRRPVILDGATGTELMKAGMPVGACPEAWILEHPQVLENLQKAYVESGSRILLAPTFTGNRIKLAEYGLEGKLEEINTALIALSKKAAGGKAYVAADMTMTGKQLFPLGDMDFEELVEVYREQARVCLDAGADLFIVETMMSLEECRAAVFAIREVCDLPVCVTMTFNEDGRTLYGTPPESAVVVLQSLGVNAVGVNCSTGPEQMVDLVKTMAAYAEIPVIAKPNAGLPELRDGKTIYPMTAEEFGRAGKLLVAAGASMVGGCCGSTPDHIAALDRAVEEMEIRKPLESRRRVLSSERKIQEITLDGNFLVVGERINPTGKKKLQEALRKGDLDPVREMALDQEEAGAAILDINMGMNGIDEKETMKQVVYEVSSTVDCPLCIDSSHVDVIEAALRIYPGRALINSISLEKEKFEKLLPMAEKYGAMFILLPLSDRGLPKDVEEKKEIIDCILTRALELGLAKEDIVVDGLVATVGANPGAALECFETIDYCRSKGLPTICGLSNISFGLPERGNVNAAFLTMAMAHGLTMAIANPCQQMLMNAAYASDLLLKRPEADIRYIERQQKFPMPKAGPVSTGNQPAGAGGGSQTGMRDDRQGSSYEPVTPVPCYEVFDAVIKGKKDAILPLVRAELDRGTAPDFIINESLIPAINRVGELFNEKKYFLPQLIGSANTMKMAIDALEPLLPKKSGEEVLPTIVFATVEGDIHDIGKNLVVLMLKNYGYRVIDLGKDVPAERIVETALKEGAAVIGLSALMTTTMMRMKDVVKLCREKGYDGKVIIGGACITASFAAEIGADGYSEDAADCVQLVRRLTE